jgi:hypothetical protein
LQAKPENKDQIANFSYRAVGTSFVSLFDSSRLLFMVHSRAERDLNGLQNIARRVYQGKAVMELPSLVAEK